MKLRCIQLELRDGTTVELKGTYKSLDELKTDIVHRIFRQRKITESSEGLALLQTAIDTGYNSSQAIQYILAKTAP